MDLTDIGGAARIQQQARENRGTLPARQNFVPAEKYKEHRAEEGEERIHNNPDAKAFRKTHWTIDKAVEQAQEASEQGKSLEGILQPGTVDENHAEFLTTTEMVD